MPIEKLATKLSHGMCFYLKNYLHRQTCILVICRQNAKMGVDKQPKQLRTPLTETAIAIEIENISSSNQFHAPNGQGHR